MLKCSLRIPYRQGALMTRSNYKENWYAKTFPYEERALGPYAETLLNVIFPQRIP